MNRIPRPNEGRAEGALAIGVAWLRAIGVALAAFLAGFPGALAGPAPDASVPEKALKLDDSISVTGGDLKLEQTEAGGIRISGTNDRAGAVFYFGKIFSPPVEMASVQVEMSGVEKPVLAIVRDENGSTAHRAIRPSHGDDLLDLGSLRFSRNGQEETFSGKVDKMALTITKPEGDFVIEISALRIVK